MQLSGADQAGIVEILNRLYLEIRQLEEEFGLIFGGGDFRPRIDYFHDAVRAYTAQDARAIAPGGRLTLEKLAYDVGMLRYLQGMPLASPHPEDRRRPGREVMPHAAGSLTVSGARADRNVKLRLSELYQQYGVLFAALFKPFADNDYHERSDALNEEVKQLSELSGWLQQSAGDARLQDVIAHLENEQLRAELLTLLAKKKRKEMAQKLAASVKAADAQLAGIDQAHGQYAMAQLGIYEEGKDIIKKLAARGMNLAGQFVEASMAQTRREMGR